MNHDQIVQALNNLAPNARWQLSGDDYSEIIWLEESDKPTLQAIEKEVAALPEKELAKANALAQAKQDLLEKMGITAEEADLLLTKI